jgi:coenzyme F420-reducing hydrogenase delta subunit
MHSWNSRGPILAFFCNWAPYRCYMELCHSKAPLPHAIYPVKVMCAGRIDPAMVLFAFEKGAEGVMVLGCKEKECRYGPGPECTERTAKSIKALMHLLGLELERFSVVRVSFDEKNTLLEQIKAFSERLSQLGKSPLVLECFNEQLDNAQKCSSSKTLQPFELK